MKTISDIFDALGGNTAVARIIKARRPSTVSEMRRRGSVPVKYWQSLVDAAGCEQTADRDRRQVFTLTFDDFVKAMSVNAD